MGKCVFRPLELFSSEGVNERLTVSGAIIKSRMRREAFSHALCVPVDVRKGSEQGNVQFPHYSIKKKLNY